MPDGPLDLREAGRPGLDAGAGISDVNRTAASSQAVAFVCAAGHQIGTKRGCGPTQLRSPRTVCSDGHHQRGASPGGPRRDTSACPSGPPGGARPPPPRARAFPAADVAYDAAVNPQPSASRSTRSRVGRVVAIVPVGGLEGAKSRLGDTLDAEER